MSTSAQALATSAKTTLLHVTMLSTWTIMETTTLVTTALLMATVTASTQKSARTLLVLTFVEEWINGKHNQTCLDQFYLRYLT